MSRSRPIPAQRPGVAAGGQPPVGADLGKESRDPYRLRRIQDLGAQLGSKIDLPSMTSLAVPPAAGTVKMPAFPHLESANAISCP